MQPRRLQVHIPLTLECTHRPLSLLAKRTRRAYVVMLMIVLMIILMVMLVPGSGMAQCTREGRQGVVQVQRVGSVRMGLGIRFRAGMMRC